MKKRIFIIAEAGVNHNGSVARARKMIDAAARAGADAIKFQTFKAGSMTSATAPKAGYQKSATPKSESQLAMLQKLELSDKAHGELARHCRRKKIMFLSTPFDLESIDMLIRLGLKIFKIPSGEITNLPYLEKVGSLGRKVLLSTGMSTLNEISKALKVLTSRGTKKTNITVLHCNTQYPTPMEDVNLRAMMAIKRVFNVAVGYSDHTPGIEVPVAAVTLGAEVIEKHFTLSRELKGPDHRSSLEPDELKRMVSAIRNIELALGDGIKRVSSSEKKNLSIARKSIVAGRDINKGEILGENNLAVKRPGTGISPMRWHNVIGKHASKKYKKDSLITL